MQQVVGRTFFGDLPVKPWPLFVRQTAGGARASTRFNLNFHGDVEAA
jgi:hypothetical protein